MIFPGIFAITYLTNAVFSFPETAYPHFDASLYRDLKAARRHDTILKRSSDVYTRRSVELTYADEYTDETTFASRVKLSGDRSTLFLEEFDHLLESVSCSGSTLSVVFRNSAFYNKGKQACAELHEGLVVVSHSSCSEAGAHRVFEVTKVEYDDDSGLVMLGIQEVAWRKAFSSQKIEFGHTPDPHHLHRHDRLSRRQTRTAIPFGLVASAVTSIIPTQTFDADTLTIDLTNSATETTFELPLDLAPAFPISLGCKDCTTKGSLVISQGEINFADFDELTEQVFGPDDIDIIESGFFQIELNDFEASILLKATPSGNAEIAYDLFSFPVLGFRIPGFGSAGVLFRPQIAFEIDIKGRVELTWGFKVNVPNKSTLRLDIGDPDRSEITGFNDTTVEALPFNANASDIELTLRAGLRPFLPIGMSFFDDGLKLLGGPYLDLPFIKTTMTQLATSNVNENCETGKGQTNSDFSKSFQNLTHITGEIGMDAGFQFAVELPSSQFDATFTKELWNETLDLPTACLAFTKETGFGEAKAVQEKIESSASGLFKTSVGFPSFLGAFSQSALLGLCVLATGFSIL